MSKWTKTEKKLPDTDRKVIALSGHDTILRFGTREMAFTTEDFLLTFAAPNFYFHATTAYNILRMKGLAIGKRDFNGRVRKLG